MKLAGCAKASVLVESLDSTVQQLKEAIAALLGGAKAPLLPNGHQRIRMYSKTIFPSMFLRPRY